MCDNIIVCESFTDCTDHFLAWLLSHTNIDCQFVIECKHFANYSRRIVDVKICISCNI